MTACSVPTRRLLNGEVRAPGAQQSSERGTGRRRRRRVTPAPTKPGSSAEGKMHTMSSAVISPFRKALSGCRVYQEKKIKMGKSLKGKKKKKGHKMFSAPVQNTMRSTRRSLLRQTWRRWGWAVFLPANTALHGEQQRSRLPFLLLGSQRGSEDERNTEQRQPPLQPHLLPLHRGEPGEEGQRGALEPGCCSQGFSRDPTGPP